MLLAGPRAYDRGAEPRDADNEGEDPHTEPDRREVFHERVRHAAREQIALGRDGVGSERAREPSRREQAERGEQEAGVCHGQDAVHRDDSASGRRQSRSERALRGEGELVNQERERHRQEKDSELCAREYRHAESEQQQGVVARPRRDERVMERKRGPDEHWVGDDLRHQE